MMDDEEQEELRCTGSDVEIEEYTDTEESPYVAYQAGDKLFDTDHENWQKFRFLASLVSVAVSVTVLVISYPLYLESVGTVSSAYTGSLRHTAERSRNRRSSLRQFVRGAHTSA